MWVKHEKGTKQYIVLLNWWVDKYAGKQREFRNNQGIKNKQYKDLKWDLVDEEKTK